MLRTDVSGFSLLAHAVSLLLLIAVSGNSCVTRNYGYRAQNIGNESTGHSQDSRAQKPPAPVNYQFVHLFNSIRWLVAEPARVLLTEDGGRTWSVIYSIATPSESYGRIAGVSFVNDLEGYLIVGGRIYGGHLLRTVDGGSSWEEVGEIRLKDKQVSFESCHFADSSYGWVVGREWSKGYGGNDPNIPAYVGTVLATDDGGKSWKQQQLKLSANGDTSGVQWSLRDVLFRGLKTGWVVGDGGVVFKTDDGGDSWHPARSKNVDYQRVNFLNDKFGWATYRYGNSSWGVATTSDGGATWRLLNESLAKGTWSACAVFFTPAHGFAISQSLYETRDGGATWEVREGGNGPNDISFDYLASTVDGVLVAFGRRGSNFATLVSDDRGNTWRNV